MAGEASQRPTDPAPAGPVGRILSAADYAALVGGERGNATGSAARVERLPSLHEEARLHGYQQGLQCLHAEVASTLADLRACHRNRDAWLQSFVFAILRKVLGESGQRDLVAAIARRAVDACDRSLESLSVHVHPDNAADVALALEGAASNRPRGGLRIDVEADPDLDRTGCEVRTPFGIIDASLETQLTALQQALGNRAAGAAHG